MYEETWGDDQGHFETNYCMEIVLGPGENDAVRFWNRWDGWMTECREDDPVRRLAYLLNGVDGDAVNALMPSRSGAPDAELAAPLRTFRSTLRQIRQHLQVILAADPAHTLMKADPFRLTPLPRGLNAPTEVLTAP